MIQSANQEALALEGNPQKLSADNLKKEREEILKERRFRFCPDCEILLFKDKHCEKM